MARRTATATRGAGGGSGVMGIRSWEDDPIGQRPEELPPANGPVDAAEPDLSPPTLPVGIAGPKPEPGRYDVGTAEFRYWAAAAALARGAHFWDGCVPHGTTWHHDVGPRLIAHLDEGVDLNAYYDRTGLNFFHGTVRGTTLYSGESPDVVCHELGHAVLDAVKPQLFDAASIEAAALHESFGDCSAMLSNLQVPSMRAAVLAETGGNLANASRLSRLAEGLGWGIRQISPDGVAGDCLRSAVNSFYYGDPAKLPPSAPASSLSSEPHSFSRVFTAGFLRMLGLMFSLQDEQSSDTLLATTHDAGTLLIEGIRRAPVVPALYAQVAAHMVEADEELFARRYRRAILAAFVRTGVLAVPSAAALGSSVAPASATAAPGDAVEPASLQQVPLPGGAFGLPVDLLVRTASHPRRFSVSGGMPDVGNTEQPAPDAAASSFVEDLIRRGRITADPTDVGDAPIMAEHSPTHRIRAAGDGLELVRIRLGCGFGSGFGSG